MCTVLLAMYHVSSLISTDMVQDPPIWRAILDNPGAQAYLQVLRLTYTHAYVYAWACHDVQYLLKVEVYNFLKESHLRYRQPACLFYKLSKLELSMSIECPRCSEYEKTIPQLWALGLLGLKSVLCTFCLFIFYSLKMTKMNDRNSKQYCFPWTTASPFEDHESWEQRVRTWVLSFFRIRS